MENFWFTFLISVMIFANQANQAVPSFGFPNIGLSLNTGIQELKTNGIKKIEGMADILKGNKGETLPDKNCENEENNFLAELKITNGIPIQLPQVDLSVNATLPIDLPAVELSIDKTLPIELPIVNVEVEENFHGNVEPLSQSLFQNSKKNHLETSQDMNYEDEESMPEHYRYEENYPVLEIQKKPEGAPSYHPEVSHENFHHHDDCDRMYI